MEPRLSLQSLFTPSESEDVTQLANEYGGCKLHITVFVQAREFVIFLYKGLSQKDVKSITFTFVSQSGANVEIKFLIVY